MKESRHPQGQGSRRRFETRTFSRPAAGHSFGAKDLLAWKGDHHVGRETLRRLRSSIKPPPSCGSSTNWRALLIGKLAMVELAGGGGYKMAGASLFGPGLNPWDRARWSGGSSSGSGALSPPGWCRLRSGSETSGSILTPAAFCGVTGLRPTYGLGEPPRRHGAVLDHGQDRLPFPQRRGLRAGAAGHRRRAIRKIQDRPARASTTRPQLARKISDLKVGFAPADMEWADADTASRIAGRAAGGPRFRRSDGRGQVARLPLRDDGGRDHRRRGSVGLRTADHQRAKSINSPIPARPPA